MIAAVIPNLTKTNAEQVTQELMKELRRLGIHVCMNAALSASFPYRDIEFFEDFSGMIAACDIVIAVGGDGTIIHAAKHAALADKPILGVNAGRLGVVAGPGADPPCGKLLRRVGSRPSCPACISCWMVPIRSSAA